MRRPAPRFAAEHHRSATDKTVRAQGRGEALAAPPRSHTRRAALGARSRGARLGARASPGPRPGTARDPGRVGPERWDPPTSRAGRSGSCATPAQERRARGGRGWRSRRGGGGGAARDEAAFAGTPGAPPEARLLGERSASGGMSGLEAGRTSIRPAARWAPASAWSAWRVPAARLAQVAWFSAGGVLPTGEAGSAVRAGTARPGRRERRGAELAGGGCLSTGRGVWGGLHSRPCGACTAGRPGTRPASTRHGRDDRDLPARRTVGPGRREG